ncbi:hypothetical protein [Roseisolibacter sp. H3M3-2]|uniref:hypothetical protein n=1 Tax=Roseisolibacter sp. H3M3-2 TaxID=3031323 RepID=UPI0023D9D53E|nr:hypothetical protein [Roseisolibacter sp. H3M3-2]MDF1504865.1 hypothetical protein [Roseisolibacter sp. H3M3-2]
MPDSPPPATDDSPPGPRAAARSNRALLLDGAALAFGAGALSTRDWRPRPAPGDAPDGRMAAGAWELCRRVVTERVGDTPTVRFPWFDARAVARESDSVYVVTTALEATGPAGAPVAVPVACRARWLGADRWLDDGTVVGGR